MEGKFVCRIIFFQSKVNKLVYDCAVSLYIPSICDSIGKCEYVFTQICMCYILLKILNALFKSKKNILFFKVS